MKLLKILCVGVFLSLSLLQTASAQVGLTAQTNTVLAGYASIQYEAGVNSQFTNDFSASFSPVLLYAFGDNFLFESELEFGLSGDDTSTSLEYAQIDYLGFENWQIIAGKFLVPFGLFGERTHPSWINKLPTAPLLYGHSHGGVAEGGALLPVLSDAGVMTRYKRKLNSKWALDVTGWVSQGPQDVGAAPDEHDEEAGAAAEMALGKRDADEDGHAEEELAGEGIPSVGYGVGFPDNNSNKMIGGRVGLVSGPSFEAYVSGFHARYDAEDELDIVALNLAIEYRVSGYDFKSEGIWMQQDVLHDEEINTLERTGYYFQLARRLGNLEPVLRWSSVPEANFGDEVAFESRSEFSVGLNIWLQPSIPLKFSYHADMDAEDHIYIQWAYGF